MERKTFKELYRERMEMPTPAQMFVSEVARITHRSEQTIRQWLSGTQVPDLLARETIAGYFRVDADGLFPPGGEKGNTRGV